MKEIFNEKPEVSEKEPFVKAPTSKILVPHLKPVSENHTQNVRKGFSTETTLMSNTRDNILPKLFDLVKYL